MQMEGVAICKCSPLQLNVTHMTEDSYRQFYWCACCDKRAHGAGVYLKAIAKIALLAQNLSSYYSAGIGSSRGIPPMDGYPTKMAYGQVYT